MLRTPFRHWRPLFLSVLLVAGVVVSVWQPVDLLTLLDWGERFATHPLAIATLLGMMVLTYTFALPGSIFLWVIAPFHHPALATALLLIGSTLGAISAYFTAGYLGKDWKREGLASQLFALLRQRSDLLTQCALRILPGFPHSAVNYVAGVLRLPLKTYLSAAVLGLAVKWAIYTSAIYGAVEAVEAGEAIQLETILPLIFLTLLLLVGAWAKHRYMSKK